MKVEADQYKERIIKESHIWENLFSKKKNLTGINNY